MNDLEKNRKHGASDKGLPEPIDFFTSVPLYQTATFNGEADGAIIKVVQFNGTLEFHCLQCQQSVVFISEVAEKRRRPVTTADGGAGLRGSSSPPRPCIHSGVHSTHFHCSRDHSHIIQFFFFVEKDHELKEIRLIKIGQYPSLADLTAGELKKYRKILSPQDFGEFSRAVGLATHGIGIGSFVYLRRIFERLVDEAHQNAKADADWQEDEYLKSRMEEKIKILKTHLPSFLAENWQIYSILSKGIHELSEEDCRAHFDILRGGIELILDQKIEAQERNQKASRLKDAIQNIASSLK
jgi:hypothetical protein